MPTRTEALVALDRDTSRKEPAPSFAELMTAVAVGRDRIAFAELFGHFAPRIEAYVRCLGVADHQPRTWCKR